MGLGRYEVGAAAGRATDGDRDRSAVWAGRARLLAAASVVVIAVMLVAERWSLRRSVSGDDLGGLAISCVPFAAIIALSWSRRMLARAAIAGLALLVAVVMAPMLILSFVLAYWAVDSPIVTAGRVGLLALQVGLIRCAVGMGGRRRAQVAGS